jgi:hypothetical protein
LKKTIKYYLWIGPIALFRYSWKSCIFFLKTKKDQFVYSCQAGYRKLSVLFSRSKKKTPEIPTQPEAPASPPSLNNYYLSMRDDPHDL